MNSDGILKLTTFFSFRIGFPIFFQLQSRYTVYVKFYTRENNPNLLFKTGH